MSDSFPPVISSCTPVMTGVTSSRDAATATWETAPAKSSAGRKPDCAETCGSVGYSSTGMLSRVKCADPQETVMRPSSVAKVTGALGRRLAMSASRRPETSTFPGSETSAAISVCADTS
jgi:hypothetical protein